ncbi:MAG: hypothetical protein J6U20_11185 [Fibrobacter sp.]|nr:hypothetical protein [Fibrobacter sp.]
METLHAATSEQITKEPYAAITGSITPEKEPNKQCLGRHKEANSNQVLMQNLKAEIRT